MTLIAPSILSSDFANLAPAIAALEEGGADWIHVDVMDGHFVPNLTIGPPVIAAMKRRAHVPLDVHLMIEEPDRWVEVYRKSGADIITVHVEATRHLHSTVHHIKQVGAKAGVTMNPATPVALIEHILGDVDLVLVMTVNPGFGAQTFIRETLTKVQDVAERFRQLKSDAYIEVDGGIDDKTAVDAVRAGANVLVAGNFVFSAPSVKDAVRALRASAAQGERWRAGGDMPRVV
jgi:ribulose-phosphate 3-epimerase